ncbi:uncharacterized protein G2W53_010248 [Senna tora]|uniref:Uncharacterized protein n=1 Tax=Senna tora TaxID=362788 RepID=A0A834WZK9_9FABA|nr:uncharacterized protein G2W53_010248 [Senna tora]
MEKKRLAKMERETIDGRKRTEGTISRDKAF